MVNAAAKRVVAAQTEKKAFQVLSTATWDDFRFRVEHTKENLFVLLAFATAVWQARKSGNGALHAIPSLFAKLHKTISSPIIIMTMFSF